MPDSPPSKGRKAAKATGWTALIGAIAVPLVQCYVNKGDIHTNKDAIWETVPASKYYADQAVLMSNFMVLRHEVDVLKVPR